MSKTFLIDTNRLPHCCGFVEAGYFRINVDEQWADVKDNSPTNVFKKLLVYEVGYPIMFNFVRILRDDEEDDDGNVIQPDGEEYQAEWLRKLVVKHKDAVHIATYINPNTGNEIDSWVILNNLKTAE